jgi:glucose/arabinose dehydrogenase
VAGEADYIDSVDSRLKLQRSFNDISFKTPVFMLQSAAENKRWYIVEQEGTIQRVSKDKDGISVELFADIRDRVIAGGEKGLLGMAFHPLYKTNKHVFLSYTGKNKSGELTSYISRFSVNKSGTKLLPDSEQIILSVAQPYGNHNGGHIVFGADGYLYIGLGDGGSAGDPKNNGQNIQTLLGALLRIDIDTSKPYAIPKDNPLVIGSSGRPEIYAWGLRNPWRWSFDRKTNTLWLADVGQNRWEEVNIIRKGMNYGWNIREGEHCYRDNECRTAGLIAPVIEYTHKEGNSITGGYVYRGNAIPQLQGMYIYGDFGSGRIWGANSDTKTLSPRPLFENTGLHISSFAEDRDGELYVLDYFTGKIFKLQGNKLNMLR